MSNDFEKIAADLRMHFCPLCKASFGCEFDEDGDCDCIGQEYCDDWRKPHCPHCHSLRKSEEKCNCLTGQMTKDLYHHPECPRRDRDQPETGDVVNYIKGLIMRDLSGFIGAKLVPMQPLEYIEVSFTVDTNLNPCTACDMAYCTCSACLACQCADCAEERKQKQ